MSAISLPSWFGVDGFSLRLAATQRAFSSPDSGSEQVVDRLNDRWYATVSLPPRVTSESGALEAFIASLRGMTNTVQLFHFGRKYPLGTMRGSPTCSAASAGASSVSITTTAGATLKAGDMIGISGLLLQVSQDCVADGSGVLVTPLVNRLRKAILAGSSVTWDRPSAPFRLISQPGVSHMPGFVVQGVSLDFVEAI